ncbi:cytochrome c-type biogenesis protein CcsB [Flagellimonas taeanensis]|uniref:Cytochrome c-type biogenesis protein CcsB n=1 Tax=Flagellimonas taeanensis TaxID=1005926 RepID=A0A1M6V8Z5_9FLAO|nr:cytochrome c biogenesis protein CcsA [Allomuricauda taeanensis]SFC19608.1 cytochrome c-type biogenesis protein CcsB [Allomuricauda taeanensis]SHK77918.1 cytochrome c-type biogenesis protein CcsB [Allomuricauda taeanensis]
MIDILKKTLFSTRLMAVLFLVFAAALAMGTFVETWYSTETARIYIYNTTWFEVIMVFFVINFFGNIFRYKLLQWKKWPVLVLHLSWILIIFGAFVTRYISYEGMMPIREGATENQFYSDKTYLIAYVDGDINGETKRRILEDDILVTPEGKRTSLPWKSDFNGQPFTISYVDFIKGAEKGLIPDENGQEYLQIVEAGDGQRHEHYLENGKIASIHNVLFALNNDTEGAINIYYSEEGGYQIKTPFEGNFMRMADQFQDQVAVDSIQPLQLRSLYSMAGMQFVVPEPIVKGKYGIVKIPDGEPTEMAQDALVVAISTNGETQEVKLLGGKGTANFSDKIQVGGLDFSLSYGSKVYELPFSIELNDFIAEKYPGTEAGYASYMSKVTVHDERPFDYDIYMNHVLDHKGYRFFQANFDPDEKGTGLSVSHDFWGTWITYIGYFLLYIGLMGIMFFGKTRFRDLQTMLQKIKEKKAAMTTIALFFALVSTNAQEDAHGHSVVPTQAQIDSVIQATTVAKEHAEKFGALVLQDESGRMKPVNTFASELLRKLSGTDKYKDLSANQVFLSMMLNPGVWYTTDIVALGDKGNDSIRKVIGVPEGTKFVKATDFFDAKGEYKLRPFLERATSTTNPDKFEKDFKKVGERLSLLNMALSGSIVKIFPLLDDENNKWISAVEYRGGQFQVQDSLYSNFIRNAMPYYLSSLQQSIASGDYSQPDRLLEAFKQNQLNHGAEVLPSDQKVKTEIIYNKLDIFNRLYKYYAMVGLLLFFVLIAKIFKERKILEAIAYGLKGTIILFFIWHTIGLILRWYISGHAPWSDAYESILYVAWATMGIGLALGRKSELTIASSAFVTCMLLWVAHQSWVDPSIANLQPVLDSYWLMIHVAVIVGSYGPLTVGMILGVVALLLMVLTTKKNKKRMDINIKELTVINELALTAGLVMLTIGNFLGGQWANESWGRYWGWDPKETWALVSIMIYAFVLHMRLVPGLRSKWIYNFASIVAYASIMMTYFGVNFYLVGLHSYASGDQVITPSFVWYTVLGVFVLGGISFWRYRVHYSK